MTPSVTLSIAGVAIVFTALYAKRSPLTLVIIWTLHAKALGLWLRTHVPAALAREWRHYDDCLAHVRRAV